MVESAKRDFKRVDQNIAENFSIFAVFSGISLIAIFWAVKNRFFILEDSIWNGRVSSRDLFGAFLFFLGVHLVVAPATFAYLNKFFHLPAAGLEGQGWVVIYSMYLACFTLFFYSTKLADQETQNSIFQHGEKTSWQAFKAGALSFFIGYPLVIAISQLIRIVQMAFFNQREVEQVAVEALKLSFDYPLISVLMGAGVIFIVPMAEELLFRGYLQGWLRRFLRPRWAIFLTSVIFSSFHFSLKQGWSNIQYLLSLFILSSILGVLYEKQRTLWAPVGLHMIFNSVNVALLVHSQVEI